MRLETLMILLAALSGPAAALSAARPVGDGPYLVVIPPWRAPEAVIRHAGGWPIGPTDAPLATLATGDGPDFLARLRSAGAWLVLDQAKMSWICGDPT